MSSGTLDSLRPKTIQVRALELPGERTLVMLALAAVGLLAAALRVANLAALGYANHYYTAAITSMLQSWHNFFFVAAEPGGSVSVDKPPLGFWLQTISAFFFGVNTIGILLPEIVAGILSVFVLYHLVQRSYGPAAGLLAALALAITPVVVATDRNNTIDSLLILTLLLAAWAFIRATESGRLRYLLLGAALVGAGFNIKMLEAFLPLPAFYALYVLGAKESLLRKIASLALATVVLALVSLSWAAIVDLTPADQRPYVGSSGSNSEMSLIAGYNGLQRLLGMGQGGNVNAGTITSLLSRLFGSGNSNSSAPANGRNGALPQANGAPNRGFDGGAPNGRGGFDGGGGGGGNGFNTGQAGPLRLFQTPLSKEVSWLLPFGLIGALLVVLRSRLRWPLAPRHQAVVLWGGWLVTGGVFFSVAGFFHEYYLSMLGAPLAALVGLSLAEVWRLRKERWWLALAVMLLAVGITLVFQTRTAQSFIRIVWWQPFLLGLFVVGAMLLALARRQWESIARVGFACLVAAMLITPGIWSWQTAMNSSSNQSLPAAYSGQQSGPANRGGLQVNQTLLSYLQAHTQGMKYLMAVPSSMQGADYVIATGRPVLYLGGFMGQDSVETGASLARMVAAGELRFIYWGGQGGGQGGFGGQSSVTSWVSSSCTAIQGYDTTTQNSGAPDGTSAQPGANGGGGRGFGGSMTVELYDCAPQTE